MSTVKTGSRIWVQLLLTVAAALLLVFVGVVIGSLLSRYWPAIVGWGGW